MTLYEKLLNNKEYLSYVEKIENMHFITNGKWDWCHGLGHYKRVANYTEKILRYLNETERIIEIGKLTALLHDIGLVKGEKVDHAISSSKIFTKFISQKDFTKEEIEMMRLAILNHSKGQNITSNVGLALLLADKLDVTYHRTINSTIQDYINKEFNKIKEVDIKITENDLIVAYITEKDFDVKVLKNWIKAITIPKKVADYLEKKYIFLINNKNINYEKILKL